MAVPLRTLFPKDRNKPGVVKVITCVERVADRHASSIAEVAMVLDCCFALGISYSYRTWITEGKIRYVEGTGKLVELRDDGKTTPLLKLTKELRDLAEMVVTNMTVSATGARTGELIRGHHNISKSALIQLVEGYIPANSKELSVVRLFPELWNTFLSRLSAYPFFYHLDHDSRARWFATHEVVVTRSGSWAEYHLHDVSSAKVKLLDVGTSKLLTASPEVLNALLECEEPYQLKDVFNAVPRKPGSNAHHHTLLFMPHIWRIETTFRLSSAEDVTNPARVFSLLRGEFGGTRSSGETSFVEFLHKANVKVFLTTNWSKKLMYAEIFARVTGVSYSSIHSQFSYFTPAGYKSLLQKLIRYAPVSVSFPNGSQLPSELVTRYVFTALLLHPGSFVPDIQRFVTGQESACKRLAVSILEDSWVDPTEILRLMMMSFLAQNLPGWRLSKREFKTILAMIPDVVDTGNYFRWDIPEGRDVSSFRFGPGSSVLDNVSALLEEVKSFTSDYEMTRSIAHHNGEVFLAEGSVQLKLGARPGVMKLEHCIDQHWCPEIAYYLPYDLLLRHKQLGSTPFQLIFRKIFRQVTGVNTRKGRRHPVDPEYVRAVQLAQELVRSARTPSEKYYDEPGITGKILSVTCSLDMAWLAGMVGQIELPGKPPALAVLHPSDLHVVAVRKPARGMKSGELEDKREAQVIGTVKEMLKRGVSMKACSSPLSVLKGASLIIDENTVGLGSPAVQIGLASDEVVSWDRVREIDVRCDQLPVLDRFWGLNFTTYMELGLCYPPEQYQNCVRKKAAVCIERMLLTWFPQEERSKILRRLASTLSTNSPTIEVTRLSKDGGGTASVAVIEDAGVLQMLLGLTLLFPRALQREVGSGTKFIVGCYPSFWAMRERVNSLVAKTVGFLSENDVWNPTRDVSGRVLKSYQVSTLEAMKAKASSGGRGHFVYLSVGLGKSLIAFTYLKWLIDTHKVPAYCIYTTPKSAITSLITEIEYFEGHRINLCIPTSGWRKNARSKYTTEQAHDKLLPGCINIIEHDHLRMMEEELLSKASQSLLIVDEVHKTLNDTKRTGVALELAKLSVEFVVMTGTPTNDTNLYKIINWLEMLNIFTVTEKNFWVAANGMISKVLNTGVHEVHKNVMAEMSEESSKRYLSLVPAGMGGTNTNPSAREFQQAFDICFDACIPEMITLTLTHVSNGEGVMLIAKNQKQQLVLKEELLRNGILENEILVLSKDVSVFMTTQSVKEGKVPEYKVVITTIGMVEGYTLSHFHIMVSTVYPSAQSTREQMVGRLNRIGQQSDTITIYTVHCGILSYVLEKHQDASSISCVIKSLAEKISIDCVHVQSDELGWV
jgi:superfamily II DNA or RNA helicase